MSTNDISAENQKHVLYPWSKQGGLNSIPVTRAEGVYFWDADGKRYIDFASQLVCVNAGHQHPKIVKAIQDQAERLCYAAPSFATDVRGRLARMIAEVTPGDLCKTYFTSSGAEAVDYAVKIAKMASGRPKIIARHRSYHGAMTGPISLTGEWRRAYNEPGMVGVVHCYPPYCYRCSFGQEPNSCKRECLSSLEEMIEFENPDFIAAIIVETITGPTAGLYVPPDDYMPKLRAICDKYGILLIADEVMSGWGRTGKWFAMDHWDVVPDILTTAKGLTNSMVPLGAVVVSKKIADFMEDKHVLVRLDLFGPRAGVRGRDRGDRGLPRRRPDRERGQDGRRTGKSVGRAQGQAPVGGRGARQGAVLDDRAGQGPSNPRAPHGREGRPIRDRRRHGRDPEGDRRRRYLRLHSPKHDRHRPAALHH